MHNSSDKTTAKKEIDEMVSKFFSLFNNCNNSIPNLEPIHDIFIPKGIIIKTLNQNTEIYNLKEFIEPRTKLLSDGTLIDFKEEEISEKTEIFGNIAQRFCVYKKSGVLSGVKFETKGTKTFQFIKTTEGWKISALAWDDEN